MSDVRPERSINWHMGWPDQKCPFPTQMVETIVLALQKPINELNAREVRLLISQDYALEYAVPVALELLASEPMIDGGLYCGDLLKACLKIAPSFWNENRPTFEQLKNQLSRVRTIDKEVNTLIETFLKLEVEKPKRLGGKKKAKGTKS